MQQKDILQIIKGIKSEYFTAKQLQSVLQTKSTVERQIVLQALQDLTRSGELFFDERNRRYKVIDESNFGKAIFECNQRGFGFLINPDGKDLFVPASKTHGAFHKDEVLYKRVEGTEDEAEIVKVLSRGCTQIVGTYDKTNGARFVLPDDNRFLRDVYVLRGKDGGAKHGQKVVVSICYFPSDNRDNPEGEIVQVLGYPESKDVDMLSVAYAFGLSQQFSPSAQARADKMPQQVEEKDFENRRDLTEKVTFTIDGDDAKDLDDAVSITANADGMFTLGVHIADVSHYVKAGDDVDKEAFARATSVYLPEMVFPMLPKSLSNGICSLYEGQNRLTLTCQMTVNNRGKVVDYDIYPSVIRSKRRLTYSLVQRYFDGDEQAKQQLGQLCSHLDDMQRLALILQNKRNQRGNIDFASKEVYFVHDDDGKVVDVVPRVQDFAHQLIEEFMIVANETVAEYAENCAIPCVYRVHDKPDEQKLATLVTLMNGVGLNVKRAQEIHNGILQDALVQAKQTPYFHLINDVMLRTMQKAKYSEVNSGHFGLASRCYCHFTSPIRRYPDLVVHRIIKTALAGKMTEKAVDAYTEMASNCAYQSNVREKIADEAERKADDVKKCAYAQTILGNSYPAIVSGVTERGIYAEMENTVEGFISVDKLARSLQYNAQQFCLYNDAVRYALGDSIAITVSAVNKQTAKIEFDLAQGIDEK